jgi:hypothetical protein
LPLLRFNEPVVQPLTVSAAKEAACVDTGTVEEVPEQDKVSTTPEAAIITPRIIGADVVPSPASDVNEEPAEELRKHPKKYVLPTELVACGVADTVFA